MPIEKRLIGVDLNSTAINSNYRAALHQKLSEAGVDPLSVKQALGEDFTHPLNSELTQVLHSFEVKAFTIFGEERQMIYLSPIGAFGLNALLTKTSPLKIAHITGRPGDVVADPTVELSAEAYRRRNQGDKSDLKIGTIHRAVRLQRYKDPNFTTSFEMFSTVDSSLAPTRYFEEEVISHHISTYFDFFHEMFPNQSVTITLGNIRIAERLISQEHRESGNTQEQLHDLLPENILRQLTFQDIPHAIPSLLGSAPEISKYVQAVAHIYDRLSESIQSATSFDLGRVLGLGHYNGPVFMMHVDGVTLVDGGSVNWVSKLTSNGKERSVVSGLGLEICARLHIHTK